MSYPGCVTTTENSATSVGTQRNQVCELNLPLYRIKDAMQSVADLYGTSTKIRVTAGAISTADLFGTSTKIIIQGGAKR